MFGFQRVGDAIWAAGDMIARGFLMGATSGRTTLAGEGLQHDDGHNILLASTNPACRAYDPTFGYEVAILVREGIRIMYEEGERVFFYLSLYNENWVHYDLPQQEDITSHILKGLYLFDKSSKKPDIHLFSSGSAFHNAMKARDILKGYGVESNLYTATSFNELGRDCMEVQRHNLLNPKKPRKTHIETVLQDDETPILAVTDFVRAYPNQVLAHLKNPFFALGTDGFGLSDSREPLRYHFEVDAEHTAFYAIAALHSAGKVDETIFERAKKELNIDIDKAFSLYHPKS